MCVHVFGVCVCVCGLLDVNVVGVHKVDKTSTIIHM